ncbi:TRAP transporter small permease subunit [Salipiger mucosus]|uniref:TRAP transporter small permease protein n=1 Tax=Salipiger mucosus DSM 16094 TaxID=1123237 RepID=S9Q4G1_9RHOB|nr:TRAP transporter small permease subunit [Salipiger mucosus]EPX76221.1 TRAP dicarboxylate transporter, DctQ subunit, unknown substrate 6 [Salipiger mucosus DSM 16094]
MAEQHEVVAAISDPGEIGRAEHNAGDRFVVAVSNLAAWLFPILMVAICAQVVLRTSGVNQAWLDDLQWWLYGAAVLVGIAYAVTTNSHVRVDIFYDNFEQRKRIRTDILGLGWLFLPFIILCWDVTLDYALTSIRADEGSDSPNGLHNLWIMKGLMNLSFILIAVATWSAYVRLLGKLTYPHLWKQLLFAFPATAYVMNLVFYYAVFGVAWLMKTPEMDARDVGRTAIFGEIEWGPHEMRYTVLAGLVLAVLAIVIARAVARKKEA